MSLAHYAASGLGGIRTSGDLVSRVMMNKKMGIDESKKYVADKLDVSVADLSDVFVMRELREDMDIGVITSVPGCAKGIEAKARIAEILDLEIPSVNRLENKLEI